MLGRSSIVLTADTYSSVLPCLAHSAAEVTAELVLEAARKAATSLRGPAGKKHARRRKGSHSRGKKAKK